METHAFIIVLHESGTFNFERLTEWLRNNVTPK